ncbi:MAG: hypothetical protein EOS08_34295 [Mesorhizobium sp.]|nr:MAG: hypothetical protein EOS08_34295 [Mesorhizobium sp.]
MSKLSQVISEREVKMGLRRVLVTQTRRMNWLAERRSENLGGESLVEEGTEDEEDTKGDLDADDTAIPR